MVLYDLLKNLIAHNYYQKQDMINKLNVFFTFNQITLEQYTELINLVDPKAKQVPKPAPKEVAKEAHTEK